ncbi:MAG: malonyl-CoA decarboxylase [Rhodospirillales bacterium]
MAAVEETMIERAWGNLARGFRDIATGAARTLRLSSEGVALDRATLTAAMQACLSARGGDIAARLKAAELGEAYSQADGEGRALFLRVLAEDFAADPAAIADAIATWQASEGSARGPAEEALRRALLAPRIKLITQFLSLPAGVKFLVDLRGDLLGIAGEDRSLRALDRDLRGLLESWFDIGFLDVRRISWDSPASLLEVIIAFEAVHEIRSWSDLRNRLESDRRLYGLFHPRMPDEPLAFVEVALTDGLASSVQVLLDEEAPPDDAETADTAIFYSICNTQPGLAGIAFGEWLIKKVVATLGAELPKLKTFATLSPIPGFARWLAGQHAALPIRLTPEQERGRLLSKVGEASDFPKALAAALARKDWPADKDLAETLQPILRRLCLRYLLDRRDDGRSLDPVARFHLRNGARLERLNWLGDTSAKGLRNAHGMMVNYLYDPAMIDANHESYRKEGKVALGSDLRSLAKQVEGPTVPRLRGAPGKSPKR